MRRRPMNETRKSFDGAQTSGVLTHRYAGIRPRFAALISVSRSCTPSPAFVARTRPSIRVIQMDRRPDIRRRSRSDARAVWAQDHAAERDALRRLQEDRNRPMNGSGNVIARSGFSVAAGAGSRREIGAAQPAIHFRKSPIARWNALIGTTTNLPIVMSVGSDPALRRLSSSCIRSWTVKGNAISSGWNVDPRG